MKIFIVYKSICNDANEVSYENIMSFTSEVMAEEYVCQCNQKIIDRIIGVIDYAYEELELLIE